MPCGHPAHDPPPHPGQDGCTQPPPLPQLADLTELGGMAAELHEVYTSLQTAGFSEERAFQLLLAMVFHTLGDNP
jgi:hypothetical protein